MVEKRALKTLRIRTLEHLYAQLGTDEREMTDIIGNLDKHYRSKTIEKKGKRRDLRVPVGRLKAILKRLNGLLQMIEMPDYVEGGRRGHDIKTNARRHANKPLVLTADIKDCFPSINNRRVYAIFYTRLECVPDVARVLTKLVTIDGALPQGSPTSSIIAALVAEKFAKRLQGLGNEHDADTSIYIDDSAISGPNHLAKLTRLVKKIGQQEGFEIHKVKSMSRDQEQIVTGIKVNKGVDAPTDKLAEVRKLIEQMSACHKGTTLERSVRGKIQYYGGLNPGAGKSLQRRLQKRLEVGAPPDTAGGGG